MLDHGWFVGGPEVAQVEEQLAERLGVKHVVSVGTGTDALLLAMRARGIGEGDEVITVSHSFVSTASSIALCGATPVFVDLEPDSMTMDPGLLEDALTERTQAVMPVHINGVPCDMEPIAAFCREHDLTLIEDCAQAFGTLYRGEPVGVTDIGCFSLHPLKVLAACGDGGFLAVNDDADADRLRILRNNGLRDRDHVAAISANSRLDAMQAAIVSVKLRYLDSWIDARRCNAQRYRQALDGLVKLPPQERDSDRFIYSMFVIRHPRRDVLAHKLNENGIGAKIHYPLAIHQQEPFEAYSPKELPITEQVVDEILSLPVGASLSDTQVERVARVTREVAQELMDDSGR